MSGEVVELVTVGEFADRLGISRSTAYCWLAEGRLETGTHVLRIKRVIRIVWSKELVMHLALQSEPDRAPKVKLQRRGTGGGNRRAIDCSYLESV